MTKTNWVEVCVTCGRLGGRHLFREDAAGKAERHEAEHTTRIMRHEAGTLDPAHKTTVERVEADA